MEKKTKIVATMGPASESPETIRQLIEAGVNVFRANCSHGDHEEHGRRIATVRTVAKVLGQHVGVLVDLCGPKLRIGDFETETVELIPGKRFVLTTKKLKGNAGRVSVNYAALPREVKKGNEILLDDGKYRLTVLSAGGDEIVCRVTAGGVIRGRRGFSVPAAHLSISSLTAKDKEDIKFAARVRADFVALSFVRDAHDVRELRRLLAAARSDAAVVVKMETREAIEHADEIIDAADVIMVARGDLAVETSPEEVPLMQKSIIRKANRAGKPVITATQMLESMLESPVPTRAEVSDIANAILDGTDAVMLSGETALGENPVEAVRVMARVARRVETDYLHRTLTLRRRSVQESRYVTDSITASAVSTADTVKAKYIVALTMSGKTARLLSRHKPSQRILAMTPNAEIARKLAISFCVEPMVIKPPKHIDDVLDLIRRHFLSEKLASKGEMIVVVCGLPFGKSLLDTNMVLVEEL